MKNCRYALFTCCLVLGCFSGAAAQRYMPEPYQCGAAADRRASMRADIESRQQALANLAERKYTDRRKADPNVAKMTRLNDSLGKLSRSSEELMIATLGVNEVMRKEIAEYSKQVAKHSRSLRECLGCGMKIEKVEPKPLDSTADRRAFFSESARRLSELVDELVRARSELLYTVQAGDSEIFLRLETIEKQALAVHEAAKRN